MQPIVVEDARSEGACRWVLLKGRVSGVLFYNAHGAGFESIVFGGMELARAPNLIPRLHYWLNPVLDFHLPSDTGPVSASVEVRTCGYRRLSGFRLSVQNAVLYAEGDFSDRPDGNLPLPASGPEPVVAELPIAAEARER